jgi:hypothetical protein
VAGTFRAMQRTVGNRVVQRSLEAAQAGGQKPSGVLRPGQVWDGRVSAALQRNAPGRPLAPSVRLAMEEQFDEDLSGVRVHTDAQARQAARQLGADAYTVGQDIFFAGGKYDPTSYQGRRLLLHELAHAIQQGREIRPAQVAVAVGRPGDRYEQEADRVAEQVARAGILIPAGGWDGPVRDRIGRVRIRERWRGADALVSLQGPATKPAEAKPAPPIASVAVLLQAAGITRAQALCIKYWYTQALITPKSEEWKRCFIGCQVATHCGLPPIQTLDLKAVKKALDAFIAEVAWDRILADPRALACQCDQAKPKP